MIIIGTFGVALRERKSYAVDAGWIFAVNRISDMPHVTSQRVDSLFSESSVSSLATFRAFVKNDIVKWGKLEGA